MRIAVWETDHPISQTVSKSLAKGFNADLLSTRDISPARINEYDAHIAYGILRGTADVFRLCDQLNKPWFNVDKGYFGPSHYDGFYRLSCSGTQLKWHDGIPAERVDSLTPTRDVWFSDFPILICPPSHYVCSWLGINDGDWIHEQQQKIRSLKYGDLFDVKIRYKEEREPLDLSTYRAVMTFNSSVGWQALMAGLPVLSDTTYSAIGSYYATKCIDNWLTDMADIPYGPLIGAMKAHQFTLAEFESGKAWPILEHYLRSSDTTPAKLFAQMS